MRQSVSLIKIYDYINLLYVFLKWSMIIFIVTFGMPILGSISAFWLSETIGCRFNTFAGGVPPSCTLLGLEMSHRLEVYAIPFYGPLMAPLLVILAFYDVLLVCLFTEFYISVLYSWALRPFIIPTCQRTTNRHAS